MRNQSRTRHSLHSQLGLNDLISMLCAQWGWFSVAAYTGTDKNRVLSEFKAGHCAKPFFLFLFFFFLLLFGSFAFIGRMNLNLRVIILIRLQLMFVSSLGCF